MHIAFLHERIGFFGGVEQNISDSARGLVDRGHKCSFIGGNQLGRNREEFLNPFNSIDLPWINGEPTPDDFGRHLSASKVDTLYVHKMPSSRFLASLPPGVRSVRMIHDHDSTCPRRHKYFLHNGKVCNRPIGWRCYADLAFIEKRDGAIRLKSIAKVSTEARGLNRYEMVIANSRSMLRELEMNGVDRARLRVIHPVVPQVERAISDAPEARTVLYVGQLIRGKGVDLLLQALALVKGDWNVIIAGDGNARNDLTSLAEDLGIANRVDFRGWTPSEIVRELYDTARVVAVPSRWPEPFGMVGIEAMRRARPVVAFAVGGIVDWLQDGVNGFLVPEQDITLYAERLTRVLEDHSLATELGRRGQMIARAEFGFDQYIDGLEEVLCASE